MPYADPEQRRAYNRAYCQAYRNGTTPNPPRRRPLPERACEECGEDYQPARSNQRFCETPCRLRWNYKRRKAAGLTNDGFIKAQRRDNYRRQHNVPPERWRGPRHRTTNLGKDTTVDSGPFAVWLVWWKAQNDIESWADLARALNVSAKLIREVINGKRRVVSLAAVTRALDRTETGLWELYDAEALTPLA